MIPPLTPSKKKMSASASIFGVRISAANWSQLEDIDDELLDKLKLANGSGYCSRDANDFINSAGAVSD